MVSTTGGIIIAVVVLSATAAVGWIVFTQLRARRLGLPPPSLSSYLFWKKGAENGYGTPRPAPGGIVGWFNDQVRKFKSRNNRSATGAYEQPLNGSGGANRGRRGFGPLDPDEAWDARVGQEVGEYDYFEGQELGHGPGRSEYAGGGSYNASPTVTPSAKFDEAGRSRLSTREPADAPAVRMNPFGDDAASSLRGSRQKLDHMELRDPRENF
ncbi:hypothetical protein DCS_00767 [Drechmeria coniospora]|uniref:Acid phosphatase-like protein n=1 Tax=Drechmeria coniospora TaxID=98403 RepID=A0A151GR81_DRECN|nr:hypothetical protein DCS_00767 [Drechmeria coniospora]KYK59634.1 hypothetical protein DCS_00767 [Drechmeria coniospora]